MYSNSKIAKAVRLATIFGASATAAISAPALAAEEQSAEDVERIEVTGSRIKRADMEGANPVQVISRQDMINTGINNVGDLLQEIPSVAGAGTNQSINNGGSGAIRVSLRGLGSERTLVLLNGRRIVASGTGADSSVDLSTIPTAIIKRVEVLKDGASAIYGSDAIGGVVNIITRDDFEGLEFNAARDQSTTNGDGASTDIDFIAGIASDKGAVVMSGYFSRQEAQWSGDRDWSKFEYNMDPDTFEITKGGSSAPPWGRYNGINSANPANLTQQSVDDDGELLFNKDGTPVMQLPTGTCNSFTHGAGSGPGQSDPTDFSNPNGYDCWDWDKDTYNYAPVNYHLLPVERYGLTVQGNYEINEHFNFFSEASYSHRSASTKLAPEPLAPLIFFGYDGAPYSADNYYNQQFGPKDMNGDTVQIDDWRRRVVETGGRSDNYTLNTTRFVAGFNGDINDNWGYEFSYIYGKNENSNRTGGNFNLDKVALAVGPSFMDENGNVVCGTAENPIAGCVSLNTFGIPGSDTEISQEMLQYVTFEGHDVGENEQQIISLAVFGDAFELPAGTVGVAFGLEHREEKGADYPDALVALGVTTGSSRLATEGSYSVDEAYFEAAIPLLSDAPFAESLDMDLAVRYSDYDTFGDTTNYKLGIKWRPMDDLMARGTLSTAFRAPSTSDLFGGTGITYPTVSDPCSTNATAYCIADGVPAGGYEALGDQLRQKTGGNPNTGAEEADIFTVGLVYSPDFVDGLSFTVDYWNIELTNAISEGIGPDVILNGCASRGDYCDQISRWPDGNVKLIDDVTTNVGGIDSTGYDFNVRYSTETDFGDLSVNLDSTYYKKYDKTLADGTVQAHAGWYMKDGDGNFAEWKHTLNFNLRQDDWTAVWSVRYIDEVQENWSQWWTETVATRTIDSQVIHNARFTYFATDYMSVAVGLDNVFDEDPPFAASGFNDNTDPRTYATNGRHVNASVSLKF